MNIGSNNVGGTVVAALSDNISVSESYPMLKVGSILHTQWEIGEVATTGC